MIKQSNLLLVICLLVSLAFTQNCVGSLSDDLIQTGTAQFRFRKRGCHQPSDQWQINVSPNPSLLPDSSLRIPGHLLYSSHLIQHLLTSNTTPAKELTSPSGAAEMAPPITWSFHFSSSKTEGGTESESPSLSIPEGTFGQALSPQVLLFLSQVLML